MPAGECRGRLAVALPAHCVAQERARRYRFNVQSMKRITLYIVLIVGGFAALMAAASWSGRREPASVANHGTRKVLYYVDPMHPAYRSDKPGTAPDCGMKLEPVYQGSQGAAAMPRAPGDEAVRVSADRRELIGVRVEAVTKEARSRAVALVRPGRAGGDPRLPRERRHRRVRARDLGCHDRKPGRERSMARHFLRAGSAHFDSVVSGGGRRRRQRDAAARGHAESARLGARVRRRTAACARDLTSADRRDPADARRAAGVPHRRAGFGIRHRAQPDGGRKSAERAGAVSDRRPAARLDPRRRSRC